jgi:hypothetical protein
MPLSSLRIAAAATALAVTTLAAPARAQNVYAYLYDPARVTSDDQLFLNLAVRDAGLARAVLDPLLPRLRSVDSDLPVILFIARQTGRPVNAIVDLRARGASWAEVFRQLGIGYDTLFYGINQDPGPYYRSTWTYWTAHRDAPRFTDLQVREMARLQLAQRLAGVPVLEVARVRNPVVIVADRRGRPYATRAVGVPPGHGGVPPGHGGVPPGQVKNGVPPGHRAVVARPAVVREEVRRDVKVKDKGHGHDNDGDDHGKGKDKGGRGKGGGKGKAKGHDKD